MRSNGDRAMEGAALANLSAPARWQGDETRALALARAALDIAVAAQARDGEVLAALRLGEAELALGRLGAAREAFVRALRRALEIESASRHEASAGLARVALTEGDTAAALAALQPVLNQVAAGGTLDGTEYPRLVELSCYQALLRAGDARAAAWLARGHTASMAQADAITDSTLRQGFMKNIPPPRRDRGGTGAARWLTRGTRRKLSVPFKLSLLIFPNGTTTFSPPARGRRNRRRRCLSGDDAPDRRAEGVACDRPV